MDPKQYARTSLQVPSRHHPLGRVVPPLGHPLSLPHPLCEAGLLEKTTRRHLPVLACSLCVIVPYSAIASDARVITTGTITTVIGRHHSHRG